MKIKILTTVLFLSILVVSGCSLTKNQDNNLGIANPASTYCEKNGGRVELVFDAGGSYGVCHFPDGGFCEERAYYNGECGPQIPEGLSSIKDFDSCLQAGFAIMESYPRQCRSDDGQLFVEQVDNVEYSVEKSENTNIEKNNNNENVVCTMDAKECPDGTYVGRTGPNCEFAPCPGEKPTDIDPKILEKCKPNESGLTEENIECIEDIIDQIK